MNGYIEDN